MDGHDFSGLSSLLEHDDRLKIAVDELMENVRWLMVERVRLIGERDSLYDQLKKAVAAGEGMLAEHRKLVGVAHFQQEQIAALERKISDMRSGKGDN